MKTVGAGKIEEIRRRIEICDYLCVAQLYLKDNFLLERDLKSEDIKPRLLGHWGTCHGINVAYTNLAAAYADDPNFAFVLGPGHGFPALNANLWLDGKLAEVDKKASVDRASLEYLCREFSWPDGFPSHASPFTPGVITEGGELGYALANAYGMAMGHPEKTLAVMIGDGELETATAIGSLNLHNIFDGGKHGKVLPILHLNGYKISAPSIYARKSERELNEMIRGFGYTPVWIRGDDPETFQEALHLKVDSPFYILKTEKGEGGPNRGHEAHQIPLKNPSSNEKELRELEMWLKSYRPERLLDDIRDGSCRFCHPPRRQVSAGVPLQNRHPSKAIGKDGNPGDELYSPAKRIGELLKRELEDDPHFYFFSPDETTSNKFDAVFDIEKRAWGMPTESGDLPESPDGRIVEMLSENVLFSTMTGHLSNGEQAMMGSYEAFFPIITAQLLQQIKFIKQSKTVAWRDPMLAVNLLSTSTCWRQDHNGFTHQSPALISQLLSIPSNLANCIFPVDDIAAEEAFNFMISSHNVVNLTTFNKIDEPRFLDHHQAKSLFSNGGASIYQFISDEDPDFVFAAAGDIVTREALEAIKILREDLPGLGFRFVGINALSYRAIGTTENKLTTEKFDELFTKHCPIIVNFHGYPEIMETILENYADRRRMRVHGFNEEGSTTTPFEMLRRNAASRYDLAIDVAKTLGRDDLVQKYQKIMNDNHEYAVQNGVDLIK